MNEPLNPTLLTAAHGYLAARRTASNLPLSIEPNCAVAQIIASLAGGDATPEEGFRRLIDCNHRLIEKPEDEILDALTRQVALLEAMFLSLTARASQAAKPDHAAGLTKAALGCQRSLQSVLGAIHSLTENRRNAEAINEPDD